MALFAEKMALFLDWIDRWIPFQNVALWKLLCLMFFTPQKEKKRVLTLKDYFFHRFKPKKQFGALYLSIFSFPLVVAIIWVFPLFDGIVISFKLMVMVKIPFFSVIAIFFIRFHLHFHYMVVCILQYRLLVIFFSVVFYVTISCHFSLSYYGIGPRTFPFFIRTSESGRSPRINEYSLIYNSNLHSNCHSYRIYWSRGRYSTTRPFRKA